MKVFLSWSGPISRRICLALRDWLPSVIQTVKPWMSEIDIEKGKRWSPAIAKELAESRAAIFCLTPDNTQSAWLNFEAGAVSNTPWAANVCTYLFGLSSSDFTGPLTEFQATAATSKDDNLRLLSTINNAQSESALETSRLERAFNTYWPELETSLTKISETKLPVVEKRNQRDMTEEILNIVRDLQKQSIRPTDDEQVRKNLYGVEVSPSNYSRLLAILNPPPISGKTLLTQPDTFAIVSGAKPFKPPKREDQQSLLDVAEGESSKEE